MYSAWGVCDGQVMIRHTKADVLSIPPPIRESDLLAMSHQEALSYDTIVSFVRCVLYWGMTAADGDDRRFRRLTYHVRMHFISSSEMRVQVQLKL